MESIEISDSCEFVEGKKKKRSQFLVSNCSHLRAQTRCDKLLFRVHKSYCRFPLCVKKKNIYCFCSLCYFVDTQYMKAVTAVSTSHVARSHPANRECEKHTEKYVHGGTYFLTCHHDGRLLFEIFSELLLRYPANQLELNVPFW